MKRVELHTYQKAKKNGYGVKHGLIGACVIPCGGYQRLSASARRLSKHIGEPLVDGRCYQETMLREKGLSAVCVITYEQDKDKTSEEWDFFENGKYVYTIKDIWRKGGEYTSNKYVKL